VKRSVFFRATLPVIATVSGLASVAFAAEKSDPSEFKPATETSSSASGATSAAPAASGLTIESPTSSATPTPSASPSTPSAPKPSAVPLTIPSAGPAPKAAAKEEDPLAIPEGIRDTIGAAPSGSPPPLTGEFERSGVYPFAYKERRIQPWGSESTLVAFPFLYGHTEYDHAGNERAFSRLYGPLYYQERSEKHDVDAVFPALYFHWRDGDSKTTVWGPFGYHSSPTDWDSWLAPVLFSGGSTDGGYLVLPELLTYAKWSQKRTFYLVGGLGFYDRTDDNVDYGVAPFYFHGTNPAKTTSYTAIPGLYYHSENADEGTSRTQALLYYGSRTPTTSVDDVIPFYFHKSGPDLESNTILGIVHWSHDGATTRSALAPFWYYESKPESTTLVTIPYTRYRGRTSLDAVLLGLGGHYEDPDAFRTATWVAPFFYTASDPQSSTFITPLGGRWATEGISSTTWVLNTTYSEWKDGWSLNSYPLLFTGRDGDHRHTVVGGLFWDFESPNSRQTVLFPAFWRFRDDEGVTQLVLNSLYMERTSTAGTAWDYYFLPIFHVGETPNGSSWDAFFGLVGYQRRGTYKQLKLFWTGIDLTPDPEAHPLLPRVLDAPAPVPAGSTPQPGAPGGRGMPGMGGGMGGGGMGGYPR
jgi:hypothetical protein